jgi:SH3-like domain-containing protein
MRGVAAFAASALMLLSADGAIAQKKPPYWASITAAKARMRTGPGRNFPASWLYQRAGLPVKVVETYPNWRKVEDPDGTQGWMQANLLSEDRTAMVVGEVRTLRASPDNAGKVNWRAEPGVIGKLSECAQGWCRIDVNGRAGFVEARYLWGADGQ